MERARVARQELHAPVHLAYRACRHDMTAVFANARRYLTPAATVVLVVDDSRDLFGRILAAAGLRIREQRVRHVNRRTGRRAGEFFEQVIVAEA